MGTDYRLYGILIINEQTEKEYLLNLKPMTHTEACTMKSKMTEYKWRRIIVQELS